LDELYAATGDAVARIEDGRVEVSLEGSGARCLAVSGEQTFAGGRGIWRNAASEGWERTSFEGDVFALAIGPEGTAWAGTEPSALFRSDDGFQTWDEVESLQAIPSRPSWSFPPRPWTSHVRWIAPSPHDEQIVLVGIELGGLMRSIDGGATWADHAAGAQRDVHCLAWHPVRDWAYEAGGGGAAWSRDAGETWEEADAGRDRHYVWALAVDPSDPERWWVSASTDPFSAHGRGDPQARIYEWRGGAWADVSGPVGAMPYALVVVDGRLVAGLADGTLLDVETGELRPLALRRLVALAVP
jgi:hypothetical protein